MSIIDLVVAFFVDPRTLGALALILMDLLTGITAAVVRGKFAWTKVADVLRDEIAPFIEGYLAFYLISYAGLEPFLTTYVGEAATVIVTALTTIAAGFSYLPILTSIGRNYLEIRTGQRQPAA